MTAERLRQAAGRLRKLSVRAPSSPWHPYEVATRIDDFDHTTSVANSRNSQFTEPMTRGAATYIATMHPGVALAVAVWLDNEALVADDLAPGSEYVGPAMAVADAVLGGDS